jgi:inner membrane protein
MQACVVDPLTHAAFGIACALAASRRLPVRQAALAGLAGGLLPDADVFLASREDPLFAIEYHRHFTHSFALSPALALAGAGLAWGLMRAFGTKVRCLSLWWPCWVAVLSHIFCDLWTSYGTRVWWPFGDTRAALHWVSVVDPLLTLPLIALLLAGWLRRRRWLVAAGLGWVAVYLLLAVAQRERARQVADEWVGRQPEAAAEALEWRLVVKPAFANIVLWRVLAWHGGRLHVLAVRCGFGPPELLSEQAAEMFTGAQQAAARFGLPPDSRRARDVARFFHFSDNWVGMHPAEDRVLADLRYAALPHDIQPLWGIRLAPGDPDDPVEWVSFSSLRKRPLDELWQMIRSGRLPSARPQP